MQLKVTTASDTHGTCTSQARGSVLAMLLLAILGAGNVCATDMTFPTGTDAEDYAWKLYGGELQKQLVELGKQWQTSGMISEAERREIGNGDGSLLRQRLENSGICQRAAAAIPVDRRTDILGTSYGGVPITVRIKDACGRAARSIVDQVQHAITTGVQATIAREKQAAARQAAAAAADAAQKRRASAPIEAVALLKQYLVRWEVTDKVDEMSGGRMLTAQSDQRADGGAPGLLRVEVQCQAARGRKSIVTRLTSFVQRNGELKGVPLPGNAQVRMGDDEPRDAWFGYPTQYRNIGTLGVDWSRWVEYSIVRVKVELDGGPVLIRIVPFDVSVRKVLESCSA